MTKLDPLGRRLQNLKIQVCYSVNSHKHGYTGGPTHGATLDMLYYYYCLLITPHIIIIKLCGSSNYPALTERWMNSKGHGEGDIPKILINMVNATYCMQHANCTMCLPLKLLLQESKQVLLQQH